MKKIALILALLFLSACANEPGNTTNSTTPNPQTNPVVSTPLNPSEAPAPSQPGSADSIALDGAISLNDLSLCEKISDQPMKEDCKTAVNAAIIYNQALSKLDPALCDNITLKSDADACKMKIEVTQRERQTALNQQQAINDERSELDQVIQAGDLSKCKSFATPGVALDCEMNILVSKAIAAKDPTICKQATTPEIVKACEQSAVQK